MVDTVYIANYTMHSLIKRFVSVLLPVIKVEEKLPTILKRSSILPRENEFLLKHFQSHIVSRIYELK